MSYTIVASDFMSSIWLRFNDPSRGGGSELGLFNNISTSYSPTTDWEKVFSLGDRINQNINMTEGEIINEIKNLRGKRKG